MKYLTFKHCCFCVPLKIGVILIGVFQLTHILLTFNHILMMVLVNQSDPNEDDENKAQRRRIFVVYIFKLIFTLVLTVYGLTIIYAAIAKKRMFLKGLAVGYGVIPMLLCLLAIVFPPMGYLGRFKGLLALVYIVWITLCVVFAWTIYSYGATLDREKTEAEPSPDSAGQSEAST